LIPYPVSIAFAVISLNCLCSSQTDDTSQSPQSLGGAPTQIDDIETEYLPNSKRTTHINAFEDFEKKKIPCPSVLNTKPWEPFHSQAKFAFAEIALQVALSNKQLNTLLQIMKIVKEGKEEFELHTHHDVEALWETASISLTPVRKNIIVVLE
jgi:hypothetical protein